LKDLIGPSFIDFQGKKAMSENNAPNSSKMFVNSSEGPPLQIEFGEN
jgi:hypothetical protein